MMESALHPRLHSHLRSGARRPSVVWAAWRGSLAAGGTGGPKGDSPPGSPSFRLGWPLGCLSATGLHDTTLCDLLPSRPPPPCPTLDPVSDSSLSGWDQPALGSQWAVWRASIPCRPLSGHASLSCTLASELAAGGSHRRRKVAWSPHPGALLPEPTSLLK